MKNNRRIITPNLLPHNRKEQYRDIINHRFMLLVLNAFFILLGFLPLLFVYSFTNYISNTDIFINLMESLNLSEDMQAFSYFWIINICYLVMIPLFIIGVLFLTGGLRIYRLLSWDEGVFFFHDFFRGIKENFKYGILIGLFIGIYTFLCKFIGGSLTLYVSGAIGIGVEIFLKSVLLCFFLPVSFIVLLLTTYFDNNFKNVIKNSVYIYGSKLIIFILMSLILLVIYIFPLISNIYLIMISTLLVSIFGLPFYMLGWNQLFLHRIDLMVDDKEIKLKGLYNPEKNK